MSAIASFASDVKGIFVDATCTNIIAGPLGVPFPPFWSKPYCLQLIPCIAFVMAHPPAWYSNGTLLANLNIWTGWSFGKFPP